MVSITMLGMLLFISPFIIMALHSLRNYLNDKENPQKKHVFYIFVTFSISFILDLIGASMLSPDMGPTQTMIVHTLLKVFDVLNMIAVFWFFVFLTDFVKSMKKYVPYVAIHLVITLILIIIMPFGVNIIDEGEFIEDRSDISSIAILLFWPLYLGISSYKFYGLSKLIIKKVAIRRLQMMSAGASLGIFAYVFAIFADVYQSVAINFSGEIFALVSGVIFYLGFVAPHWLRRRWEKDES